MESEESRSANGRPLLDTSRLGYGSSSSSYSAAGGGGAGAGAKALVDRAVYDSDPAAMYQSVSPVSPTWKDTLDPSRPLPEGTVKGSIFTLLSTIIGGGVLSLPFTFAGCGLGLGVFLTVAMALASSYSANLLVWSAHRSGGESYEDIAHRTYGASCSTFVSVLVLLLVYMASIGYVVLMGDLTTHLFPSILDCSCHGAGSALATYGQVKACEERNRWIFMAVSIGVVYPVTLVKKLSALRFTSFISVMSIVVLAVALSYESAVDNIHGDFTDQVQTEQSPCMAFHPGNRLACIQWIQTDDFLLILLSIPILACSYMCHFNVLPMHKELRRATRERMGRVISFTMGLSCTLYLVVATAGYFDFLTMLLTPLGGNVLNLYLQSDVVVDIGRAGLLGTILLSFPLLVHPCRSLVEKILLDRCSRPSTARHFIVTTVLDLTVLVIGSLTPDIVVVWSVLGSTVAIMVAYVIPPLLYMKTLDMTPKDPREAARLIATPMPGRGQRGLGANGGGGRDSSGGGEVGRGVDEGHGSSCRGKCAPAVLFVGGVIFCIVCTGASIYNIVTPRDHVPGTGPNMPCMSNISNRTNGSVPWGPGGNDSGSSAVVVEDAATPHGFQYVGIHVPAVAVRL